MRTVILFFVCCITCRIFSSCPSWIQQQIENDFQYFKDKPISWSKLDEFYEKKGHILSLIKYTIFNNHVRVDSEYVKMKNHTERIKRYEEILTYLCVTKGLPNTTLLISVSDGLNAKESFPIFAMCKMDSDRIILIPDYESLGARYQVLKYDGLDITQVEFPWENKASKLIWRGSTAQYFLKMTEKNLHRFSRLTLCQLGEKYPSKIDAKFTLFIKNADQIPSVYQFQGDHVAFKDQMYYKYHILIDGNVAPYTKSGWKFFTNSLLFKPHSRWVQWYFGALQPYTHYVPVHSDLSDLIEKMDWALENDEEAKQIASNCRIFALNHLTLESDLAYLYEVIMCYHGLNFVP